MTSEDAKTLWDTISRKSLTDVLFNLTDYIPEVSTEERAHILNMTLLELNEFLSKEQE